MSPQSPDNLDLQHLQEMRQRTKERLYKLQESLASFGMDAPSHLRIDAERAQKDLELIEARMQTIGPSPEVTATIGVEGRMTVVEWRMNGLADKLADALTYFGDQLAIVREEAREWRESERRAREERQKASDERLGQIEAEQLAQAQRLERIDERISAALLKGMGLVVVLLVLVLIVELVTR